jgi:hypothetical protein
MITTWTPDFESDNIVLEMYERGKNNTSEFDIISSTWIVSCEPIWHGNKWQMIYEKKL